MALDPGKIDKAAAGDPEALTELILAEGKALRAFIAAHVNEVTLVSALELASWSAVRRQLSQRDTGVPVAEWLRWVAAERIERHLQGINLLGTDEVTRLVVQDCLAALAAHRDQQAAEAAEKVHGLSADMRDLLQQRYGDGQGIEQIATRRATTADLIAAALATARSACDWRSGEPAMGDRLLPRLLEDWLGGVLDPDSRALLMEGVTRSPMQATALVRQVRLHAVLTVVHQTFGLREAKILSSAAVKAGEGRDQASSFRGRGVSRTTGNDSRRPPRVSSNVRTAMASSGVPSIVPFILVGVVVVVGVLVLLLMMGNEARPVVAPEVEPEVVRTTEPTPPPVERPTPVKTGGGILRPEFGGGPAPTASGPLTLAWAGSILRGTVKAGDPVRLEVAASRPDQITAIEFRMGDRLLATITRAPFTWEWRDPQPGNGDLIARAVGKDGSELTSIAMPLRFVESGAPGKILREWWRNIGGRTIAEGLKTKGYPNHPFGATFETEFSARRNWGDTYLQRMRGYVVPPSSGAYTFWIVGDDEAELRLSSDELPANLKKIAVCLATDQAAVSYGKWDERSGQRSEPVNLEAGRRYYIEVLHKEQGGNDHVAVGWQLPDGTQERPIPGNRLVPPDDFDAPPGHGVRLLYVDFDGLEVGKRSSILQLNSDAKVPAADAQVAAGDTIQGRHYLEMRDAAGQEHEWMPELYRMADYSSGVLRVGLALRMHAGGSVVVGCRHLNSDKSVINGPAFSFNSSGVVSVNQRELARFPLDTWVRFTVTVALGSGGDGTWKLSAASPTGPVQEFPRLTYDQGFSRLNQFVISNTAKVAAICDLDDLALYLE